MLCSNQKLRFVGCSNDVIVSSADAVKEALSSLSENQYFADSPSNTRQSVEVVIVRRTYTDSPSNSPKFLSTKICVFLSI